MFLEETAHAGILARWFANSFFQGVLYVVLCAVCWHRWSATPGKMVMRLRIADAVTEAPITTRQAILRILGYFLSAAFFCVGFLSMSFNKQRQCWHDKLAGTVVLVKPIPWRQWFSWKKPATPDSPAGNP